MSAPAMAAGICQQRWSGRALVVSLIALGCHSVVAQAGYAVNPALSKSGAATPALAVLMQRQCIAALVLRRMEAKAI